MSLTIRLNRRTNIVRLNKERENENKITSYYRGFGFYIHVM